MNSTSIQIRDLLFKLKKKGGNAELSFDLNCKKFNKIEYLDLYKKFEKNADILEINQNIIIKKRDQYQKKKFINGINMKQDINYIENNIINPIKISSKINEILDYTINLDTNSTIFINSNDSKRIGLIFKSV